MSSKQELIEIRKKLSAKLKNAKMSLASMNAAHTSSDDGNRHRLELRINDLEDSLTYVDSSLSDTGVINKLGGLARKVRGMDPKWKERLKDMGQMNAVGAVESYLGFLESLKNGSNDSLIESIQVALCESHPGLDEEIEIIDEPSTEDFDSMGDEYSQYLEDFSFGDHSDELAEIEETEERDRNIGSLPQDELERYSKEEDEREFFDGIGSKDVEEDVDNDVEGDIESMGATQTGNALSDEDIRSRLYRHMN